MTTLIDGKIAEAPALDVVELLAVVNAPFSHFAVKRGDWMVEGK